LVFRAFDPELDLKLVVPIINKDRLKGQPLCTPEILLDAVGGRASSDAHLWHSLEEITTLVFDLGSGPVAIVSFSRSRQEPVGELLWLYADEQQELLQACVDHVLKALDVPIVRAFSLSSALTVGGEGLPTTLRTTTRGVLAAAGFKPDANWTYMTKPLDQNFVDPASGGNTVVEGGGPQWLLSYEKAGERLGHVEIGVAGDTGVIWYIYVEQSARRHGIARCLLEKAEGILAEHGAHSCVACLDEGTFDEARDRFAAKALFEARGFQKVDLLQSFSLDRPVERVMDRREECTPARAN
jgi:ribosomal protein S18 acetylase RimI-like enzyme